MPVVEDPPRGSQNQTVFELWDAGTPVQQTLNVADLTATQRAFDAPHVHRLMRRPKSEQANTPIRVVRMGGKNYVTDGHHRAIAKAFLGQQTIRADVVMV